MPLSLSKAVSFSFFHCAALGKPSPVKKVSPVSLRPCMCVYKTRIYEERESARQFGGLEGEKLPHPVFGK